MNKLKLTIYIILALFASIAVVSNVYAQREAIPQQTIYATNSVQQTQNTVVYITSTGACYHSSDCRYLRKSKIKTTLAKAKSEGYRKCSRCSAPE
jgi:hypothetical protein